MIAFKKTLILASRFAAFSHPSVVLHVHIYLASLASPVIIVNPLLISGTSTPIDKSRKETS